MAQRTTHFPSPKALYSENKDLFVNAGSETIALDDISSIGYNKFGVTLSNSSTYANSITVVNIYGSEDKINFYALKMNIFSGGIGSGATMHYEFVATVNYMKMTVQSTGLCNIDLYLIGNTGSASTGGGGGGGSTPGAPGTGTVQSGIIQFVNTDTGIVTLSLPYADTNYAIELKAGSNVLPYYDAASKTGTGFTIYTSAPFTGEVSYTVAHP